ncbi:MAG: ABC transporter permease [Ignavibacteria bacterium]|nr:ABC transporter permease [Ignavibacteria bacterium]
MKVSALIARRYLRPRKISMITVVGIASVVGIVIGTAALIIVMSLFNGLRTVATDLMIGFGPHLQILAAEGSRLPDPISVTKLIDVIAQSQAEPVHIIGRTSTIRSRMIIQSEGKTGIAEVVGIQRSGSPLYAGPRRATIIGSFNPYPVDGISSVVVAAGIAERLQLFIGDTVTLITPQLIEHSILTMSVPNGRRAVVRGIFQSNTARSVDNTFVYTDYRTMASATHDSAASTVDIYVNDPRHATDLQAQLSLALNAGLPDSGKVQYAVHSWQDLNRGLVDTMKLERLGTFIVLALIVLVASFNVLVSLTLGVVEKRRDIAVLLTMGLLSADIRRIYIIQGLTIGSVSVILGVIFGVIICWGQQTFHWIAFDVNKGYIVPALPVEMHVTDIVITAVVGLILAGTAALYPASRASGINISDAIRVE